MKIGVIATGIWGSVHLELAKELALQGHTVTVYTEDKRAPSGALFTRIEEDGVQLWVIHNIYRNPWTWLPDKLLKMLLGRLLGRRFFTTLVAIWRYIRANRDSDFFMVESAWIGFVVSIVSLFESFRWIVGIHDTDYLTAPISYPGRPVSRFFTVAQNWMLKRANLVRSNSYVTTNALTSNDCPAEKIITIPLHYVDRMIPQGDVIIAKNRCDNRAFILRRLGLTTDVEILITMCRLTPVKNLELAIEALSIAKAKRPKLMLMICGGDRNIPGIGSYSQHLYKMAIKLGVSDSVILTGEISPTDVQLFLAAADIHLAPSYIDTFNYAVIEATLVHTYSLTSRNVGSTHWIERCGAGRTVLKDTGLQWATEIISILGTETNDQIMKDCASHILHDLSVTSVTKQLLKHAEYELRLRTD